MEYKLIDKKDIPNSNFHQILELHEAYPEWRTCGAYSSKKDAVKDLAKLKNNLRGNT